MLSALAIDLGTTAAKAAVVSVDGRILGAGLEPVTTVFGEGGSAEQDAEAVWQAVLSACRQAVAAAPDAQIKVVCPTSQWASIVPVDANGCPTGNMVMWLDRRGESEADALLTAEHFVLWPEIHGFVPVASLGHILWLQRHRPDVHARTEAYLEPMDYLAARLTGRIAASANSVTPMALTDNRDLGDVHWSDELIERAGVDRTRLPELVPSLSVLGPVRADIADALGVGVDAVVAVGANDSIAAALGTGAYEPGRATVVIGTTGVLTAHHASRVIATEKFVLTMPSALRDRYYVVAEAGLAGKVVEWCKDTLLPDEPIEELFALAQHAEPGCGGAQFLPWLNGSLAPAPNGALRGSFVGVSLTSTRADLVRAVLEGVSMQMRWLVDEVEATLATTYPVLRLAGGGAQSDVWAAITADVLGRPIEQIAEPRHANSRGAAFLGFLTTGDLALSDVDALVPVRRCFEPVNPAHFDERLIRHRELNSRLRLRRSA